MYRVRGVRIVVCVARSEQDKMSGMVQSTWGFRVGSCIEGYNMKNCLLSDIPLGFEIHMRVYLSSTRTILRTAVKPIPRLLTWIGEHH